MSKPMKLACFEQRYATAYQALLDPDTKHVREGNWEAKRCNKCGGWHLRPIAPLDGQHN